MTFESLESRQLLAATLHPDVTWADDGLLRLDFNTQYVGVAPQGIITARTALDPSLNQYVTTWQRHGFNGQVDSSYNIQLAEGFSSYTFVDPQGRLLIARNNAEPDQFIRIGRYTTAGALDTTFGENGVSTVELPAATDYTFDLAIPLAMTTAADGSTFFAFSVETYKVVPEAGTGPGNKVLHKKYVQVAKFDAGGDLETSFGQNGFVVSDLRTEAFTTNAALAVDAAGRLVVASTQRGLTVIRRFSAAGALDSRFGTRGVIHRESSMPANGLHIDAQNRVLLADMVDSGDGILAYVSRYTAGGKPDLTFAHQGTLQLPDTGDPNGATGGFLVGNNGELFVTKNLHILQLNDDGTFHPDYDGDVSFSEPQVTGAGATFGSLILEAQLPDGDFLIGRRGMKSADVVRITESPAIEQGTTGRLYIYGTDARDTLTVRDSGGGYVVERNGVTSGVYTSVDGIYIEGLGGSDRIAGDFTSPANAMAMTVLGGGGNDVITTGAAADSVNGGAGNDTIATGGGFDQIQLIEGNNVVSDSDGGAHVLIQRPRGNNGAQIVNQVTGTGGGGWSIDSRAGKLVAAIVADTFNIVGVGSVGLDLTLKITTHTRIEGSTGDDILRLTGLSNDTIVPDLGNDTVYAGAGNDFIGGDRENAGVGRPSPRWDDYYDLGAGDDKVADGYGNHTILGGDGEDTLLTGSGNDSLFGGLGRDDLRGGAGNDTIEGEGSPDLIFGQEGNDKIAGGNGNDTVVGGIGNDTLYGNAGNDLLIAGNPHGLGAPSAINRADGGGGIDRLLRESEGDLLISIESVLDAVN